MLSSRLHAAACPAKVAMHTAGVTRYIAKARCDKSVQLLTKDSLHCMLALLLIHRVSSQPRQGTHLQQQCARTGYACEAGFVRVNALHCHHSPYSLKNQAAVCPHRLCVRSRPLEYQCPTLSSQCIFAVVAIGNAQFEHANMST